jgi:DNA primase
VTGAADLDALRALVSIAAVLHDAGIDAGERARRIACPLHGGSNTSAFTFDAQRFVCWACGCRGDIFELVSKLHQLTFREAKAYVARLAGVDLATLPRPARQTDALRRRGRRRHRPALPLHRESRLSAIRAACSRPADSQGMHLGRD